MSYLVSQYSNTSTPSSTKHHSFKKPSTQTKTDVASHVLTLGLSRYINKVGTDSDLSANDGNVYLTLSSKSLKYYTHYLEDSPSLAVMTREDQLLMEAVREARMSKK